MPQVGSDTALKKRNEFVDSISSVFECVVCKDVVQKPQFGTCCRRDDCVKRWFENRSTCHHCSAVSSAVTYTSIRELDDILHTVRTFGRDDVRVSQAHVSESDSDFVLPAVNFRNSN